MTNWMLIGWKVKDKSEPNPRAGINRETKRLLRRAQRRYFRRHPKALEALSKRTGIPKDLLIRPRYHARRHEGPVFISDADLLHLYG